MSDDVKPHVGMIVLVRPNGHERLECAGVVVEVDSDDASSLNVKIQVFHPRGLNVVDEPIWCWYAETDQGFGYATWRCS